MDPISSLRLAPSYIPSYAYEFSEEQVESLAPGWAADEALQLMVQKGLLTEQGDCLTSNYKLNTHMREEIAEISSNIRDPELMDPKDGIAVPTAKQMMTWMDISLPQLVTAIYEQLNRTHPGRLSEPEIIGGAVPRLLGKKFYIAYLQKKLGVSERMALYLGAPFLETISKKPNDYDYRQWIAEGAQDDRNTFKEQFATVIQRVIKQFQGPPTSAKELKARAFKKLNYFQSVALEYGMASFGSFGGAALDCILMYRTNRPYLFTRDRLSIVFHPTQDPMGQLLLNPELAAHNLPQTQLPQEITLLHQLAMILDTPSYEGINAYGWLSAMALTSKGWRTLRPDFFYNIWLPFEREFGVSNESLEKGIRWIEENHLAKGNPSARLALRFNFLMFLIDHVPHLSAETIQRLMPSTEGVQMNRTTEHLMQTLKKLFQTSPYSPAVTLAWFRIAFAIHGLKNGLSKESISTNYGVPCYRQTVGKSFTLWIPLRLAQSCHRILNTPSIEPLLDSLLSLIHFSTPFIEKENAVPQKNQWISTLVTYLQQKKRPDFLKLALTIEQISVNRGIKAALQPDWYLYLPILLERYPEELSSFTASQGLQLKANLKRILSPLDWVLHLAASQSTSKYALEAIAHCDLAALKNKIQQLETNPAQYFSIYRNLRCVEGLYDESAIERALFFILKELMPSRVQNLSLEEGHKLVPWILFLLSIKRPIPPFALRSDELVKGSIKVSLDMPSIIRKAVSIFGEGLQIQDQCIQIFLHLFKKGSFDPSPSIPVEEVKPLIETLSHKRFIKPLALRILLEMKSRPEGITVDDIPKEWLEHMEILLRIFPDIGKALEPLFPEPLRKWMQSKDRDKLEWIKLLVLDERKHLQETGGKLWRNLSYDDEFKLLNLLLKTFHDQPQAIASCIRAHGALDFNESKKREFLIRSLRTVLGKPEQELFVEYIEKTFPKHFIRKPGETVNVFMVRVDRELCFLAKLEFISEVDDPLRNELRTQDFFLNHNLTICAIFLKGIYNSFIDSANPGGMALYHCQASIIQHQVLIGELPSQRILKFCNPFLIEESMDLYVFGKCAIIAIEIYAFALGALSHLHLVAKPVTQITAPSTLQNRVHALFQRSFKPLMQISLMMALMTALTYLNDTSPPNDSHPFIRNCLKEVDVQFSEQLQLAEWRGLGMRNELLQQLQDNLCRFDHTPPHRLMNQFLTLTAAFQFGKIIGTPKSVGKLVSKIFTKVSTTHFPQTMKHQRLLSVTHCIAHGSIIFAGSLYSQYNAFFRGEEECLRKSNYTLAIIGDTRRINPCPENDRYLHISFMIITISFAYLLAKGSYIYGNSYHSRFNNWKNTCINQLCAMTPRTFHYIFNLVRNPMLSLSPFLVVVLTVSNKVRSVMKNSYSVECRNHIETKVVSNDLCQLPTRLLASHLCNQDDWAFFDQQYILVACSFFILAGILATPANSR